MICRWAIGGSRTTNPIESTFATIRHRTDRTKGCVSRNTLLAMIYKLGMSAEKRWRRIQGFDHLAKVIKGVKFKDRVEVNSETDEISQVRNPRFGTTKILSRNGASN